MSSIMPSLGNASINIEHPSTVMMWIGYILAIITLVIGIATPEYWKRRRLAEIDKRKGSEVVIAIERMEVRLTANIWQVCAILLTSLIASTSVVATIITSI